MNRKYLCLSILILGYLSSFCNNRKSESIGNKADNSITINTTAVDSVPVEKKHKIYHLETISVDSIVGNYHLSYKTQDDNQIIITYPITDGKGNDTVCYANREVILTISKDGKSILSNRKIKRADFSLYIPKSEIYKYCISNFKVTDATSDKIKFSINFCVPDSDICYWFELTITNDGNVKIKEIIEKESDM